MWLFLILVVVYIPDSWAIKCYTCGGSEDQGNLSCLDFHVEDPRFIRQCEDSSRSCRISQKVNENLILSRSCEQPKMDDCKTLNSIEFCYCTKDLCNVISPLDDDDDDGESLEDLAEGSGTDTTTNRKGITLSSPTSEKEATEKSSKCSKSQLNLCLIGMIVFAVIIGL